jgi:hypothetical protein
MSAAAVQAVAAWLTLALTHWTPAPRGETHDMFVAERGIVADAIAGVTYDPAEPPIYKGRDGRARTALLIASIASYESGLQPRLAQGLCKPGECDHGLATGLLQTHMGTYGLVLLPGAGFRYCGTPEPACVTADTVKGNEGLQVRVALHFLRMGGIGRYTGEGDANGLAARRRTMRAETWIMRHPAPPDDVEPLALE